MEHFAELGKVVDHYAVLQLPDGDRSTSVQIKRSYYALAKIHHPDKADGDEKIFQLLQEAYETLSTVEMRSEWEEEFEMDDGEREDKFRYQQMCEQRGGGGGGPFGGGGGPFGGGFPFGGGGGYGDDMEEMMMQEILRRAEMARQAQVRAAGMFGGGMGGGGFHSQHFHSQVRSRSMFLESSPFVHFF